MSADRSYVSRMVARARYLREADAFEPADYVGYGVESDHARLERRYAKLRNRVAVALFAAVLLAVGLMSLCLPYTGVDSMGRGGQIYPVGDVLECWGLWFKVTVMPLFDATISNRAAAMISEFDATHTAVFGFVILRGAVMLAVVACGALLAVSGMLFQTSFRNPLAAPTMLGVADGVTVGCIVFAYMGFASVADNVGAYFACVYGFGALAVVAVILLSRLIGGRSGGIAGGARFNVFNMLLLGTVLSQLLGGAISYVTNFVMDLSTWERFYELQQATGVLEQEQTWIIVAVVFVCTMVLVVALRFRLNLVAFPDDEARMMGARPGVLRGVALVLGSVMQLAAIASIGPVAMLSLAVPFLVRYLMPGEFRMQLLGNVLLGILVLMAAVTIQHFAVVGPVTVPIGTVVSVLVIPFFAWAVALGQNRWGD
ncbi:MAG: iron chelate uptake ABC transporter family permease subunit [Eggerthellaceae bacterium]|nr:iron chelate uptake ABC transporter family permease subunit [Eggerthellaceae bacterium]